MAWVSPKSEYVSKMFTRHLFAGKRWWLRRSIDSALGRAVLEAGRNHYTSVQPLVVDKELAYGITVSGSDNLYLVSNDKLPNIAPSEKYSEKLPLLLRIALTYADFLISDFNGPFEEPILPSAAYEQQYLKNGIKSLSHNIC